MVDLRRRTAYAAGHLPGSLNFGIDGSFLTYLGWLIPWGTPVSLVAHSPGDAMTAVRELCRIGIDRAEAITGSCPIPLHELQRRLGELPADRTVWVHCAAGYRASIAAGLLEAPGRHVILIDDDIAVLRTAPWPEAEPLKINTR